MSNTRRRYERKQTAKRFNVDSRAHPLVRKLADLVARDSRSVEQIASAAGANAQTFYNWTQGRSGPTVLLADAFFQTMGYRLDIVPIEPEDTKQKFTMAELMKALNA